MGRLVARRGMPLQGAGSSKVGTEMLGVMGSPIHLCAHRGDSGQSQMPCLGARLHRQDVHKHKAPVHVVLTWGGPSGLPAALVLVHPQVPSPQGNQG